MALSRERVCVCDIQAPFVTGGAELLVESLVRELRERDYAVEVVRLPFKRYPKEQVLKDCLAWRLLDLGDQADRVIATRFPAYLIRCPRKVVWLVHQFRPVYDLLGTPYSDYGSEPGDPGRVALLREMDNRALPEAERIFTIAGNVARRLAHYNGIAGQVLYPPPKHEGQYRDDGYGDYLFAVSRLDPLKRLDLVIRAMQYTRSRATCLIAGTGAYGEQLRALARELGVADKVSFLGYVSDARLIELYAGCFAVFFAPHGEDYGFITVEAFKSRKPVITASDSGAVLEFVEDGRSGYVLDKDDVRGMAARIDELFEDRHACQSLGQAGYERVREITWERTVATLMAEA